MLVIRTAKNMARALDSPLDSMLRERLAVHHNCLLDYSDFAFEELGLFLIAQSDDTLEDIQTASPIELVWNGHFMMIPEAIEQHGRWLEILFILSDDGFGIVLFVALGSDTDPALLTACKELLPTLNVPGAE